MNNWEKWNIIIQRNKQWKNNETSWKLDKRQKKHWKNTIATCGGFHGSITWSNMRLRMFSWPICSEPVVSLGIEQNQCSAQCNSIGVDIVLQKGSTPAAYNREIYSVTWSSYQRWLSTKTCAQIGWFCCNAFCSDSTCTHPVCSSSLHVGLFWEG